MADKILASDFFKNDTRKVACELLGKIIVRKYRGKRLSGIIVETEAYRGFRDTACHAHKGPTDRCKVMFGDAGFAYVYLTYGIHNMLNFVTEKKFYPAAVLIRAIEPVEGVSQMQENRNIDTVENLTSGPGKLTKALNIDRSLNGLALEIGSELWVEEAPKNAVGKHPKIGKSTRIGIDYADDWAKSREWRYYIEDNPYISK